MTEANITCPDCGHTEKETIPEGKCLHSYECKKCHKTMQSKDGDCCVFCSYADKKCDIAASK